jgi:predicted DCC family thiol-disulfide oxidoreductase YuxK
MHDAAHNSTHRATILFDGVCNFCCGFARFVIRRDPDGHFLFASLQSDAAKRLLGEEPGNMTSLESVLLVENGRVYRRSTAALRICRRLHRLWPMLYVFIVIPAPVRDVVYDLIGRNRYRWFGKKESCWVPGPEWLGRFLED